MGRVLIQQDQCPSKKRRLGQGCTQWVKAMWQHSQRQEDASTGRGLAEVAMTAPAPGGRPGIDSPMEPSEGITCWHLDLGLLQSHETLDTVVAHNVCFFVMAAPADKYTGHPESQNRDQHNPHPSGAYGEFSELSPWNTEQPQVHPRGKALE